MPATQSGVRLKRWKRCEGSRPVLHLELPEALSLCGSRPIENVANVGPRVTGQLAVHVAADGEYISYIVSRHNRIAGSLRPRRTGHEVIGNREHENARRDVEESLRHVRPP